MTTTHKTTVSRMGHRVDCGSFEFEIPIALTIEWSRDRRDDMGHGGPAVWWRDNMVAHDAHGMEILLDRWEMESFTEKYVRELP